MTREEKSKAIDALKISAPIMAVTQEEFKDYIQTLNKVMDWLEQEPILDKIRAEIEALPNANPSYTHTCDVVDREDVFDIIDEYKAESEDKE